MKFGPRELLLLVVLLAVPLSSYWLVFRPQNREINQARTEIEHKKLMLDKLRTATSKNDDLIRANKEIEASIASIEARLPTNKEVDAIVRQVSDLAVAAGLEPPVMKSEDALKAALYMEQPLKMEITGDFNGFYDFLVSLEKLPRITRIPDLKIKRSEEVDGFMKAEFTLSIYFQQDEGDN